MADQRGVYNTNYTNFAPRVGLAYSPIKKLVVRAGYGIFYTPAMEFGDYQGLSLNGFSQTTPYVGTLDGVTPQNLLSNPFPTGLLAPVGQANGGATNVGQNINAVLRNRPSSLRAAVDGKHAVSSRRTLCCRRPTSAITARSCCLVQTFELNQLPTPIWRLGISCCSRLPIRSMAIITSGALSGATIPYGQLLRPFPEYTGVENVQPPSASSTYNALALSANRRFSNGLQFLVSYTWSKYLTNNEGPEGWTNGQAQSVQNWYNTSLEKSLMIDDIPRSLVVSYVYEIAGRQRAARTLLE